MTLSEMLQPVWDGTGMPPEFWGGGSAPPPLTLTLTATPASVPVGTPLVISATASADPADLVVLNYTLNGGAPVAAGPLTETAPTTWSNSVDTLLLVPGSVYDLWATSGTAESNHVAVTIAATVAGLRQFAADNGIDVPEGAKKADLLALVGEAASAPALTLGSVE